jgi:hypothetical protein
MVGPRSLVGHWRSTLEGYTLSLGVSSHSSCLLSAMMRNTASSLAMHHDLLLHGSRGNGAKLPWAESSEIVSQNKPPFLL